MLERTISREEQFIRKFGRVFVFDPERMLFIVGNGDSRITMPILQGLTSTLDIGDFFGLPESDIPLGLAQREQEYFLVLKGFDLIVMPALKKYLESLNWEEWKNLQENVLDVIAKVMEGLTTIKASRDDGGFRGLSVRLMEGGNFNLTTIGDCACMGPQMHRTRSEENTSDFPQVYDLHNADMPWQRLCLYAGLGAMAWYAETETARDY